MIQIPAGDYLLKAYEGPEENIPVTPSKEELGLLLGEEDFRYYQRVERSGCLGYLSLLLFPCLWPLCGWKFAAAVTAFVVLAYFPLREYIWLRRNERFQRVNKSVNEAYVKAAAKGSPIFLFEFRLLEDSAGKSGGSIDLRKESQSSTREQ